jgi:hypothetical protein
MNLDEPVVRALRALAERDRAKEAPSRVEEAVLREFRRRRVLRQWRRAGLWTSAVAAAAVIVTLALPGPQAPPAPAYEPVSSAAEATVAPAAPSPAPVTPAAPARRPRRAPPPPLKPREVVTEFFPLVDVAPPFESGELVRVTLPAAAMRTVGLPVREDRLLDRIQADVLVGQEGMARAIRFVSFER